jgi:hypothetical protein
MRPHILLALFVAVLPLPATAQSAAWAQDRREPMCIYDGLLAAANGTTPEPSRMDTVRAECRQRFGWTADQTNRGTMVAMIMAEMIQAQHEAGEAGVDQPAIDDISRTFTRADAVSLGQPGQPVTEAGNETMRRVAARVLARGFSGDAGLKATRAIVYQMLATHLVATFAQEVLAPPAP